MGEVKRFGRTEQGTNGVVWSVYEAEDDGDYRGGIRVASFLRREDALAFTDNKIVALERELSTEIEHHKEVAQWLEHERHDHFETRAKLARCIRAGEKLLRVDDRDEWDEEGRNKALQELAAAIKSAALAAVDAGKEEGKPRPLAG